MVRNLITIGEAAAHIPNEFIQAHAEIPWRLMTDMRNFAVHQYWSVDPDVIWNTSKTDLPVLKQQIRAIQANS